jgi:hypothetical protein
MKGLTPSQFLDQLDDEFAWRRKELTTLRSDVRSGPPTARSARLRGAVAMLYAHWEGFVKASSDAYVEFVARRRLRHTELSDGFLSLALRSRLKSFAAVNDIESHVAFVRFLLTDLPSRARIPKLGVIRTGSNLNSRRLKAIVRTLGLDYTPFELKENLLDAELLGRRNQIAHGKAICPSGADFELLYQQMTSLLREFKDQLAHAVVSRSYRRI